MALYKISLLLRSRRGSCSNDLDKAVDDMDKELPVAELVAKGKAFLERLLVTPEEQIAADLDLVDTLVSTTGPWSSLNNVQENIKDLYQEATEAIEAENYERSTARILYKFYEMYYYNDVQDDINTVVARALNSRRKLMEEASEILYEALEAHGRRSGRRRADFDAGAAGIDGGTAEAAAEQIARMQQTAPHMQSHRSPRCRPTCRTQWSGDMAEHMRLAKEFQQKMMEQALKEQQKTVKNTHIPWKTISYRRYSKATHSGGSGSCFYPKAHDLFVTNYHVTEGYRTVAIHDNDPQPLPGARGRGQTADGHRPAGRRGRRTARNPARRRRNAHHRPQDLRRGYPYGMPFTITEGSVSAPKQLMDGKYYIQTRRRGEPRQLGRPDPQRTQPGGRRDGQQVHAGRQHGLRHPRGRCASCSTRSATSTARNSKCSAAAATS